MGKCTFLNLQATDWLSDNIAAEGYMAVGFLWNLDEVAPLLTDHPCAQL